MADAQDFWGQFQPYEGGGITGQPNVDPSQLQYSDTAPSISLQNPAPTSPMLPQNGGGAPRRGQTTMPMTPPPPNQFTGIGGPIGAPPQWNQQTFSQQFGTPGTPQELAALEPRLQAAGIKVLRNAAGVAGKIQLPDGSIVDVINSAGAGGNGFQWLTGGGGGNQPGYGSPFGLNSGYMVSPIGQFTPPSYEDALKDPGTLIALQRGQQAIQNSAAARGTLLSGGTLKALNDYAMGTAAQGYNDVYGRAANTFGINYGVQTRNQDAPFSKSLSLADLGQRAASAS